MLVIPFKANPLILLILLLIRYNFVTPLTSLVVVRPEDRKEIDKELQEEEALEEKRRIKNEKKKNRGKYKIKEEAYMSAGRVGSSGAGFYGDPHFVIPLRQSNLNLCFNWDGEEGDVSNHFYFFFHHYFFRSE